MFPHAGLCTEWYEVAIILMDRQDSHHIECWHSDSHLLLHKQFYIGVLQCDDNIHASIVIVKYPLPPPPLNKYTACHPLVLVLDSSRANSQLEWVKYWSLIMSPHHHHSYKTSELHNTHKTAKLNEKSLSDCLALLQLSLTKWPPNMTWCDFNKYINLTTKYFPW